MNVRFIEFFGSAHLNGMNVGAYKTAEGFSLMAEDIETGKIIGKMAFESYEEAEEWFGGLDGTNNISRLDSAITLMRSLRVFEFVTNK